MEEQRERGKICTGFEVEVLNWIESLIAESDQENTESSQDVIKGQPKMIQKSQS